jgi:hypothetical protein
MIQRPLPPIRSVLPGNAEHGASRRGPRAALSAAERFSSPANVVAHPINPMPVHQTAGHRAGQCARMIPPNRPATHLTERQGRYNPHRRRRAAA